MGANSQLMKKGSQNNPVEKVLAYIVRKRGGAAELLVHTHCDFPEAGIQVPAGTIDDGESPEQALLREIAEESGLAELDVVRKIGVFDHYAAHSGQYHRRNVFELSPKDEIPEQWDHVVTSGEADAGLVLRYFWIDVARASELAGSQGAYL